MASADVNESLVLIFFFFFNLLIPVSGMLKWLHGESEMVIMIKVAC